MSSTYAGADVYLESPTLPDDGDTADAAGIGRSALESAMDRTTWLRAQMKRPKLVALGALPYVTNSGHFSTDYNFMSVTTATAVGDDYKATLLDLVHGVVIQSIDVIFLPKNTHAGNPATPPSVTLARWNVEVDTPPALVDVIATASYVPLTWPDYINGEFKRIALPMTHTVDAEGYVYQLVVTDESGANAIVGNSYVAFRINYVA